jgi:hypothetical protein
MGSLVLVLSLFMPCEYGINCLNIALKVSSVKQRIYFVFFQVTSAKICFLLVLPALLPTSPHLVIALA